MFCVKCGIETGDDQEFCEAHAPDAVASNSVKAQLDEKQVQESQGETVRCPSCNELVFEGETNCPACGAQIPAVSVE